MAQRISGITESPFSRVVAVQLIVTILASALCLTFDRLAAISAFLAGVSALVPTIYLLVVSLRPVVAGESGLSLVIRGQAGKFALTVALLVVIFVFVKPLNIMAFFGTYALLQMCHAVVPLLDARRLLKR